VFLCRVILEILANVSEESTASMFRVSHPEYGGSGFLQNLVNTTVKTEAVGTSETW
jgi:hypothetical protein